MNDCNERITERRAPLGILSRGPVWAECPKLFYADVHARMPTILDILTLQEGEELVDFLCSLDQVCTVPHCEHLCPDYFREQLAFAALFRGDADMAVRHYNQMTIPSPADDIFQEGLMSLRRQNRLIRRRGTRWRPALLN